MPIDTNSGTWLTVREWAAARLKKHAAELLSTRADPAKVPAITARIDELRELIATGEGQKPDTSTQFVQTRSDA